MGWEIDSILVGLVLINFLLLGAGRLGACIRLVAIQGVVLGLLPLLVFDIEGIIRALILAGGSVVLKGVVFPRLLRRALREANVRREVQPYVGFTASLFAGMAGLAVAIWLGARLPLPQPAASRLLVPVALFTMLTGLFLIVSRRTALTQVLGYLVLENGIFTFGVGLNHEAPLSVELGVLLDVFVAVFIMGIIIYSIGREFDNLDVDRLTALKDWDE